MEATFIHSDPLGPTANSSYYRILAPAQALQAAGHTIHLMQGGTMLPAGPHQEQADLIDYGSITETVLIERELSPEIVRRLRYAGARRIVLTFDDHYGQLPAYAPRRAFWDRPNYYRNWLAAQKEVDEIIAAGPALAEVFHAGYVPNYLDPARWQINQPARFRTIIGWGGSREHRESWEGSPVITALHDLQARHPGRFRLVMVGHAADPFLDRGGVLFERNDLVDFAEWPKQVARFDIGLAPLRGEYDRYRSHLKVLEYATLGIPWLATEAPPYAEAQGGILIPADRREAQRWASGIEILLSDQALYTQLSESGTYWANNYRLEKCVPVYEEILWPTRK